MNGDYGGSKNIERSQHSLHVENLSAVQETSQTYTDKIFQSYPEQIALNVLYTCKIVCAEEIAVLYRENLLMYIYSFSAISTRNCSTIHRKLHHITYNQPVYDYNFFLGFRVRVRLNYLSTYKTSPVDKKRITYRRARARLRSAGIQAAVRDPCVSRTARTSPARRGGGPLPSGWQASASETKRY